MTSRGAPVPPLLQVVLEDAREQGFLGARPVTDQIDHAAGFAALVGELEVAGPLLDLGAGGGLPGLVVAAMLPAEIALLDAGERRVAFLEEAVERLGWVNRVRVLRGRAEELGRSPELRGGFEAVLARSFGPPPVTAECGAPFLREGGVLIVSDPPAGGRFEERWPEAPLAELGFAPAIGHSDPYAFAVLRQQAPCPERYPRRVGVPAKRPLYRAPLAGPAPGAPADPSPAVPPS